jgi:lambda repressor-like predicted transcriptional regulator
MESEMTVAIPIEVEVVRDLDERDAIALTGRIKSAVGDLMILVAKAWQGRVWIALGYDSWPEYIKGEFNHAPLSLPRDERKAVVALLRGQGMSTRAIGSATGVDQKTIVNDLAAGEENSSPQPVTGLDGKTYPKPEPDTINAEVVEEPETKPEEPWRIFTGPCNATSLLHSVGLLHDEKTAKWFAVEVQERNRLRAEMIAALRKAADTLEATHTHRRTGLVAGS